MRAAAAWLLPTLSMAMAGCATPLPPVVEKSLNCGISPALLEPCTQPIPIQEGITYGQIIDIVSKDRENLRICAQRQESLAGAAADCQAAVAKHNQEISELNARNAKQ